MQRAVRLPLQCAASLGASARTVRTAVTITQHAVHRVSAPSSHGCVSASFSSSASSASSSTAATAAASAASPAAPAGALSGIRVLDLSRILAGPFCTQILGDLGADVIKVEHPVGGDDTRFWGPPFRKPPSMPVIHSSRSTANAYVHVGESAYFLAANRNKRSIAVNLKHEAGRDIILQLARHADVVVENMLPGKLDEMGIGYEALSAVNPSLIYASLSGFGLTGPLAQSPGYDVMASARGGLMHITGSPAEPAKVGVAVTDLSAGLYLHGAILAALFARERDPQRRGQRVDTNLLEVCAANLANIGQNYHLDPNMKGRRWGTAHESIVPYQAFRCRPNNESSDAAASSGEETEPTYFICGALNNKQFVAMGQAVEKLCALAASDPAAATAGPPLDASFMRSSEYANNALRVKHRETLLAQLQSVFERFPLATLLRVMDEHSIPCSPINDVGAVFADPQIQHAGLVRTVQHEGVGEIRLTGSPVHYSRTEPSIRRAPPMLGFHTQDVLQEVLGAGVEQIKQWEQQGAIGCYHEVK